MTLSWRARNWWYFVVSHAVLLWLNIWRNMGNVAASPRTLPPGQIRLFANSLAASTAPVIRGRPLLPSPYMPPPAAPVPIIPHAPFIPPHPIVGYGPPPGAAAPNYVPLPYSPVTLPDVGSNPLEVRGGTVYFSADMQKQSASEVHPGTMYFDPTQQTASVTTSKSPVRRAKSAIPIVDPQVCSSTVICVLQILCLAASLHQWDKNNAHVGHFYCLTER